VEWNPEIARAQITVDEAYGNYMVDSLAEGDAWARRAEARLKRIGGDPGIETTLTSFKAALLAEQGDLRQAQRLQMRALDLAREVYGSEHPRVATLLWKVAGADAALALNQEALEAAEEALAMQSRLFGPDSSATLSPQLVVASAHLGLGDYDWVLASSRTTLAAIERELGPDDFRVGEAAALVGEALLADGDAKTARAHFSRSRRISEKAWGADNYTVGIALSQDAEALRDLGRPVEAGAEAHRAIDLIKKGTAGKETVSEPLCLLGDLALDVGHFSEAAIHFRKALAIDEQVFGADGVPLSGPLTGIGEAALGEKNFAEAALSLERAIKLREGRRVPRQADARTRFALARALWEQRSDRERALRLAHEAREGYLAGAKRDRKTVEQVDAWLATHRVD
jgi:eukaryotic-like serine/threonine-protein kinase